MLSIFIVFVSVVGFTTLGFSLLGQDDYNNFFISKTENIMIEDEYQYFDDLGIKLEFINIDDNSLTLGINVKYEDIADYKVIFNNIKVLDKANNYIIENDNEEVQKNIKSIKKDKIYNSKSELQYIICYEFYNEFSKEVKNIEIVDVEMTELKNISNNYKKELNYKKEISIEE